MTLVETRADLVLHSAVVLAVLWIAIALLATGFVGMQFNRETPAGSVLATVVWATALVSLAALPLFIWMGEILFRSALSEEMFAGSRPGSIGCPAGSCTSTSWPAACSAPVSDVGRNHRHGRQDRALRSSRSAATTRCWRSVARRRRTLGILIPPSIMMVIYAVQAKRVDHPGVSPPASCRPVGVMALYSATSCCGRSSIRADAAGRSADAIGGRSSRKSLT